MSNSFFAGEVISDSSLVQTILDALLDSYQTFASTWRLMTQGNPAVSSLMHYAHCYCMSLFLEKTGLNSV